MGLLKQKDFTVQVYVQTHGTKRWIKSIGHVGSTETCFNKGQTSINIQKWYYPIDQDIS
jgi:hypothetical protein